MRQNLKLSSLQLWCKYQGGSWTQQSCIQLCSRQLGAGGVAATEGQCCSSAGATRWNMEIRSSGSSMYVPHVITICSACIHSSVNKLTDNISIVSADCRSSPAILILSRICPVTSDCKAAEASWQLSLQIQTVLLWHSVSPWTRSLFEAEIRRHLIRVKSRYIFCLEPAWRWKRATETSPKLAQS